MIIPIDAWQATMQRLDAEEAAARQPAEADGQLEPAQIRSYVRDLGRLWRDTDAQARQGLALALFDEISVTGFLELRYRWSAAALRYGLDRIVDRVVAMDLEPLGLQGGVAGVALVKRVEEHDVRSRIELAG